MKKYIAYGSNLNLKQMAMRCPTAKVLGTTFIENYKLAFRGVATIEPCKGCSVPVAVWLIDDKSEKALDIYEGYPKLYRKENFNIKLNGQNTEAMVYIMNKGETNMPSGYYYHIIEQGYNDVGLNKEYLEQALKETYEKLKK